MKKSLLFSLLLVASQISAYSYFADNTTPFAVKLKLTYDRSNVLCTSADKVVTIPANRVGVKIEDTMCCVDTLKASRVDALVPKDLPTEESSPSKRCGTNTFVIYANQNGTVSVID